MSPAILRKILKRALCSVGYEIHRIERSAASVGGQRALRTTVQSLRDRAKISPVRLHIGCGPRVLKGWMNIDLHYEHFANYMQYYGDKYYPSEMRGDESDFWAYDVTKARLPLPDDSVDVIFHEDFIEHLSQRDQILFLAETLRILKPGAIHRVNTPNLLSSMRDHSEFARGFRGVYVEEWNRHNHLSILTPQSLEELALMVGYSKVLFSGRNKSASAFSPLEYRPDPRDRPEDGNIFADLVK